MLAKILPEREKYKVLEEIILELRDLPNPIERAMDYSMHGNVPDTPEYRAFIGRLAAAKDNKLQQVAIRLRRILEQTKPPRLESDPPSDGPGPGGVEMTPIALKFEGIDPSNKPAEKLRGLISAAPGVDVAWTNDSLHVMTIKGSLRLIWRAPDLNGVVTSVVFDGKYVWTSYCRLGSNPLLIIFDPVTEKIWDISGTEGVPRDNAKEFAERGFWPTSMIAALEPGRVCLASSWRNNVFSRAWVATVTFDSNTGKAKAKVILEGKEAPDRTDEKPWTNTRIGFTPHLMVTLRGPAGADGKPAQRVLIGRTAGQHYQIRGYPLVVDPDRRTVEVMNEKVETNLDDCRPLVLGGSMYYLRLEPKNKLKGQLVKISLPGLTHEIVADDLSPPLKQYTWLVAHDDRIHVVVERATKVVEKPSPERGGLPIREGVKLFDWSVLGADGKNRRLVASEVPSLHSVGVSAHYGIVAFTFGGRPHFPMTLHAVKIAEQTR